MNTVFVGMVWGFDWEGKSVRGHGRVRKMRRALASTYTDEKLGIIASNQGREANALAARRIQRYMTPIITRA